MDARCDPCGARLYDGAEWCTQCYAPVGRSAAPFSTPRPAVRQPEPAAVPAVPAFSGAPAPAPSRLPSWAADPAPAPAASPYALPAAQPPAAWTPNATASPYGTPIPVPPIHDEDSGTVFRLGLLIVIFGLLVAAATYFWGRSSGHEPSRLIRDGLLVNVGVYVVVFALVVYQGRRISFRPVWTEGDPTDSLLRGLLYGGGLAAGLMLLGRLLAGHVVTDDGISVILSERTIARTLLAILLVCVAAPWVEELLFRGLLAESMRSRGLRAAARNSGILFALWHPQAVFPILNGLLGDGPPVWVPFIYYVSMGAMFARLYFKRGLKSSIAAHTAFNGVIIFVALAVVGGPTHIIEHNGVKALVPATWRMADSADLPPGLDLAIEGPSGSGMVMMHFPNHQRVVDVAALEATVVGQADQLRLLGIELEPGSAQRADFPMGMALRLLARADGHSAEIVLVPGTDVVWEIVLLSGGSKRAKADFQDILEHMQLPASTPLLGATSP